jgi:hypothetical protein
MKIPNAENAIIDIRKLRDYCLDESHPVGKHKARLFASALNLDKENAEDLHDVLLIVVRQNEAEEGKKDEFGQRYTVDFELEKDNKRATVRSGWIIETKSDIPKLTTCFIL